MREFIRKRNLFQKPLKLVMFDSIKEMPISRLHELDKIMILRQQVGDSLQDVFGHYSKLHKFLTDEDIPKAIAEAKNLHNNLWYIIEDINLSLPALATFVYSVNGKVIDPIKDQERALKWLEKFELTEAEVEPLIEEVKKKYKASLEPLFLINSDQREQRMYSIL